MAMKLQIRKEHLINMNQFIACLMLECTDYIKFLKYGYGKATDHACRDIRLNRITREEGILLAKEYDSVVPKSFDTFLKWLEIDKKTFYEYIEPFRDEKIWKKNEDSWELKDSISNHINDLGVDEVRLPIKDRREYKKTKLLEEHSFIDDYILMGRSYMDAQNFKAVEG